MSRMPLHLASTYGHDKFTMTQDSTREARRMLAGRVRNDWEYPPLPEWNSHTPHPLDPPHITEDEAIDMPTSAWEEQANESLPFEPIGWKERDYSSSDSMASDYAAADFMDLDDQDDPSHKHRKHRFLFASPDSVGDAVTARRENRKRKRTQMLEEEMAWNAGLAHFVARRNAWTCARQPGNTTATPPNRLSVGSAGRDPASRVSGESSTRSMNSEGLSITSRTPESDGHSSVSMKAASPGPSTPASSPPPPNEPGLATLRTMVPIPPPMLKDHPIRAKINSSAYSEIYSKIILQSRAPTVPINLNHITRSLVRGWIEEGNWPPKQAIVEPLMGKRRKNGETKHPHLRKGVQAVGRVLGLGISHDDRKH